MKEFCTTELEQKNKYGDLFRNVLTLNTSRSFNLVIDFVDGGIVGYVKSLINESMGGLFNGK